MKCNDCGYDTQFTVTTIKYYELECDKGTPVKSSFFDEILVLDETQCDRCQSKNLDMPEKDRSLIHDII